MNGDIVCRSVAVLNHTRSAPPRQDENPFKLTPEGRRPPINSPPNDVQRQGEGWRTSAIAAPRDCWSDEPQPPSPPQLYRTPTCFPAETSLALGNGLRRGLLLADNGHQRRDVRRQRRGARSKKPPRRIAAGKNSQNRKVTDYYPIRRSSRKSETVLKCEEKKLIDDLLTKGIEEGLEIYGEDSMKSFPSVDPLRRQVRHIEGKGRAVFATRCFQKGEYVVEYHGDLLQITDAKSREAEYAQNPATGCYMYYFQYLCKTYCVDATKESGRLGRLINHSKNGNCQTKLHDIDGVPHLILVASRDVDEGEELLYDYGDRSKASIAAHPWLKY